MDPMTAQQNGLAAILAASGLAFGALVAAQGPTPPPGRGAGPGITANVPPPRTPAPGPYAVTVESYPTLATHTTYHPTDLARVGATNRLPIVAWGNGACVRNGTAFQTFLTQIASHGYLAIAIGAKDSGAAALPPTAERPIDDQMLIDAIDWAIAENRTPSSRLYGKVDTTKIAVMGQSCGGLQAMAVSPDPRVTTTVIWNSGVLPADTTSPGRTLSRATKDTLNRLHAPIAYFIGGPGDVAYPNAEDDFARISNVPVFKANINVGHGGTYRQPGGGWFGEVAVAWLDWRLKGNTDASKWFVGADCRLCTDPAWSVERKGM
jgi:hypothetical protein